MREIEFFGNGSFLKNQLRNSGFDMQGDNLLSNSIDAWSMSRSNMSKGKLNETVKSDEFLNSKLYTNTQKIQAIDIIDYSKSKGKEPLKTQHKGVGAGLDSSFSNKYNAQLVKTANSFFPSNNEMGLGGQLKM